MKKYSYIILKYVPDAVRSESLNVALLMYCQEENFLRLGVRDKIAELKTLFPDIESSRLRAYLAKIAKSFEEIAHLKGTQLDLTSNNIYQLATSVLPSDYSALRWDKDFKGGISSDIEKTFDSLCKKMVDSTRKPGKERREDDEVWNKFSGVLTQAGLTEHLQPQSFRVGSFRQTYEHTFKNGVWHCLVPMSMDYSTEQNLLDRMNKEIGKMQTVKNEHADAKFYFLVGAPRRKHLMKDYQEVKKMFQSAAHVVTEDRPEELTQLLAPALKHLETH